MSNRCKVCNGKGVIRKIIDGKMKTVKCPNPSCLGGETVDTMKITKENKKLDSEWKDKYLPNNYFYDNEFDKRLLIKECPLQKDARGLMFDAYVNFLDEYITSIDMGILPKKSYFISAPDRFGKKHFVYTVIKKMFQRGHKTSELLSIYEVYSLLDTYQYEELNKKIKGTDLILLDIGANPPADKTRIVINYLVYESERRGIPLIVISQLNDTHNSIYGGYNTMNPCSDRTKIGELGRLERKGITKEQRYTYNRENNTIKSKKKYNSDVKKVDNYSEVSNNNTKELSGLSDLDMMDGLKKLKENK